jgi:MarR family transcriptional regulator, organic hydroperoxide resistance regulator
MGDLHADHSGPEPDDLLQLDNQLCFALHSAARQVVREYRGILESIGVTYTQYLVLLVLWEWDRQKMPRPTILALGERLDLDSGTLTPLLKRMDANGLLTRTVPEHDRRERYIHLTPAGRNLRRRARQVPASLLKRSPLSLSEITSLRDHVNRLRAVLSSSERQNR